MGQTEDNRNMHKRVEWMVAADESILRLMTSATDDRGDHLDWAPRTIAWNTGYSSQHVGNRCRVLSEKGLLKRIEHGRYTITHVGIGLVEGDISPSEIE